MTVLIVDDHGSFRASARALLEAEGYQVVGEAADGAQALAEFRRLRPELVLLDVQLPDMTGFQVAEQVAADDGRPQVILTSSRDVSDFGDLVTQAPARGFIAKDQLSGKALIELLGP
jgi:DNA-binding NarL/FixJ family response regulator